MGLWVELIFQVRTMTPVLKCLGLALWNWSYNIPMRVKIKTMTLHWSFKIKHLTGAKLGALSESTEKKCECWNAVDLIPAAQPQQEMAVLWNSIFKGCPGITAAIVVNLNRKYQLYDVERSDCLLSCLPLIWLDGDHDPRAQHLMRNDKILQTALLNVSNLPQCSSQALMHLQLLE